jgi:hypothetical protein
MNGRVRTVAAVFFLSASLLGCSSEETHSPSAPAPVLDLSASATSVVANGVNAVTLTVTDTSGAGPITLTTNRGTFSGGGTTTSVAGASGTATLVTCNAATSGTCAGTATVSATGPSGSDSVNISFGSLASVCPANCAADAGCATLACNLTGGGTGTCSSTTPSSCVAAAACTPNPAGATTETSCEGGVDDDCDGDVDCEDADCDAQACRAGSPTFLCKSGACTDTTSGLAITVTPARTRLPAVAGTTTAVTVRVTGDDQPLGGMAVTIATTFGTLSAATGTTGADGTATFTFTAPAGPGVATITASLTAVPQITASATLTMPRLGSFQLPENPGPVQHAVMGAKGSGWNEFGWIQVQVLDDVGNAYPDGLPVRFEHRRLGGSTLGAPLTADVGACTAASGCVGFLGQTASGADAPDADGLAAAWVYSGTVAGTLVVTATTTAGGVTRSVTLPTVAVVGARASGANFAVTCARNVPALAETDCAISLVDAPFGCEALLKDRFNNVLGTATQVVFVSEASAVGQVATTPPFAAGATGLGVAVQLFDTLGAGLPFDVAPAPGEPSVDHALDGCGTRTHNPRDGVVTVVAVADGEEGFFDANGNGAHDAGEPFVDQGEPFVDQDDSGAWEPGEWFLDVNGDGAYELPNGTWDAARKIWTQTVVVYTGRAATMATPAGDLLGTRWADAGFVDACTATPVPPDFAVDAAVTTPAPLPPTSEAYVVVASDLNLNFLHSGTSYAVAVQGDASATADYRGLASYTDLHGFFYRYWPCDRNGACASQCRASGAAAPCEMRPAVTGFSCGVAAAVIVTGGDQPDPGLVSIDWNVDVPWDVYGSSRLSHGGATLTGTSN